MTAEEKLLYRIEQLRYATDEELQTEIDRPFRGGGLDPDFDLGKWIALVMITARKQLRRLK